jgi:hypothetical protein
LRFAGCRAAHRRPSRRIGPDRDRRQAGENEAVDAEAEGDEGHLAANKPRLKACRAEVKAKGLAGDDRWFYIQDCMSKT